MALASMAAAQVAAPPEVSRSAIMAVEALGDKIVQGEHQVALDRMYPQWKERMAKRQGGIEKLQQELAGIGAVMARNGMSIISVKVDGATQVFEVSPESKEGGDVTFGKWLALVPTVTRLRILVKNETGGSKVSTEMLNMHGFQVAIADKERLDWTFINGTDVSVSDLRSLFVTLPANLKLPEVRRELED